MQTILDYLAKNKTITNERMMNLLGLKRTRAYLIAKQMIERGLIDYHGRGQSKVYTLRKDDHVA